MIHFLAKRMASIIILKGIAKQENEDIYIYANEMLISTIINIICCISISIAFSQLMEGIIFLLCFASIRFFSGGHHAKQHIGCIAAFSSILTISHIIMRLVSPEIRSALGILFALCACGIIIYLSPVEHSNKQLSKKMKKRLRKGSWVISCLLCVIAVLGHVFKIHESFFAISLSMLSVSGSMVYALIIE